jgi:hypothetical protein
LPIAAEVDTGWPSIQDRAGGGKWYRVWDHSFNTEAVNSKRLRNTASVRGAADHSFILVGIAIRAASGI